MDLEVQDVLTRMYGAISHHPSTADSDGCRCRGNENSMYLPKWASLGVLSGLAAPTLRPANRRISAKVGPISLSSTLCHQSDMVGTSRKQGLGILVSSTKSHDISEICEIT